MIDYRYHLVSLVAVFLALGVGVLIGNSFLGVASAEWQKQAMLRLDQTFKREMVSLRQRVDRLSQQNRELESRLETRDKAERALMPVVLDNVLAGRRVALVVCGDLRDEALVGSVSSAIKTAGGVVQSVTAVRDNWLPDVGRHRSRILERLQVSSGSPTASVDAAHAIATAIVSGEWSQAMHDIAKVSPGLSIDGDYTTPADAVLLISFAAHQKRLALAEARTLPEQTLLDAWNARKMRVVAAEPEVAPVSMIPVFQRKGVPTVDNVDSAVGQISAVLALAGGQANYGVKPTAEKPVPEIMPQSNGRRGE
ncbi:MAG: copper transporter [Armatimonadota bacterium]